MGCRGGASDFRLSLGIARVRPYPAIRLTRGWAVGGLEDPKPLSGVVSVKGLRAIWLKEAPRWPSKASILRCPAGHEAALEIVDKERCSARRFWRRISTSLHPAFSPAICGRVPADSGPNCGECRRLSARSHPSPPIETYNAQSGPRNFINLLQLLTSG